MRCGWADNVLVLETDGYTRPCCAEPRESARLEHVKNGMLQAWKSEKLEHLRNNLNEHGFSELTEPFCSRCREQEQAGQPSLRTRQPILGNPGELKAIQFKLSNICQLACAHCGPSLSSQHNKYNNGGNGVIRAIEDIEPIIKDLREVLPQLEWIKFTGGEPWHDIQHWKILEGIKDLDRSHLELRYITNGMSKPKEHLWEGYKNIRIDISVDGLRSRYNWFRRNGDYEIISRKFEYYNMNYDVSVAWSMTPWTVEDYDEAREIFGNNRIQAQTIIYPMWANLKMVPEGLLALPKDTPGLNTMKGDTTSLAMLRTWGERWDKRWGTPGWVRKLYPWLYHV